MQLLMAVFHTNAHHSNADYTTQVVNIILTHLGNMRNPCIYASQSNFECNQNNPWKMLFVMNDDNIYNLP